jgi:siroheme synthase
MGRETLPGLAAHLIEAGMSPLMPAIAVENASLPNQHITHATLSALPRALLASNAAGPTVILLGEALQSQSAIAATLKMATAE